MDDLYNVITPTNDLQELENNMYRWSMMPYDRRMHSDDMCRQKYGMSNIELYNQLKANILNNSQPEADISSVNNLVKEDVDNSPIHYSDWGERKLLSDQIQKSPCYVLIDPPSETYTYSIEDLNMKYQSYNQLLPKYRIYSDQYSVIVWGYNVTDIYNIIKKDYFTNDYDTTFIPNESTHFDNIPINLEDSLSVNQVMNSLQESKESNSNTYIGLMEINNREYLGTELPSVTPYFTPVEMQEFYKERPELLESPIITDANNYYNTMSSLMTQYQNKPSSKLEETILANGWNPSVDFTTENINYAKSRQVHFLEEYLPRIIDITNTDTTESIEESTSEMRDMYKKKGLYPIYIVLSYSYTAFGRIIKAVKGSKYSHAGLSTDSDLKNIYTFKFGGMKKTDSNGVTKKEFYDGFSDENLGAYLYNSKDALIDVLCVFVNKGVKDKVTKVLRSFSRNKGKTHYAFDNILNILFSRAKKYDYPDSMNFVCSQFVDTVLKLANVDITNKSSNLVIPQDFANITKKNPKVYKVYKGLARDFTNKKIENNIKALFNNHKAVNVNSTIKSTMESYSSEYIKNNINDLLTVEAAIQEFKFPISFNSKGDVTIELLKNLEDEYQTAHTLLKTYTTKNLDGIKHELCRLFWINAQIEKKLKKMKKGDKNYKKFVDLRARVLNDFKKYFKIVLEVEPSFNFAECFKKSEYYTGAVTIDNETLKFTGKMIAEFIKMIGGK